MKDLALILLGVVFLLGVIATFTGLYYMIWSDITVGLKVFFTSVLTTGISYTLHEIVDSTHDNW